MLLYVIIFVLVLVVAVALIKVAGNKKKAQPESSDTKTTAKKSNKTAAPALGTQSSSVPADVKKKIEAEIYARNFANAEALINLELNRDQSQHELYLMLLDMYLEQKDELALDLLMKTLHAQRLDQVIQLAEAKIADAKQQKTNVAPAFTAAEVIPATEKTADTSTADFDALVNLSVSEPVKEEAPQLLEFHLETPAAPVTTAPAVEEVIEQPVPTAEPSQPLEVAVTPSEAIKPAVQPEKTAEVAPLEFNFSTAKTTQEPVADAAVTTAQEKEKPKDIQPLEFTFSTPSTAVEEKQPTVAEPAALDFNFSNLSLQSHPEEQPAASTSTETPLEISTPVAESAEGLAFKVEPTPEVSDQAAISVALEAPCVEPVAEEAPTISPAPAETAEIPAPITPVEAEISAEHANDPIAQNFPQVLATSDAELNLELAEHYISLGAYSAARALLTENSNWAAAQQEQAKNLLNRIAS